MQGVASAAGESDSHARLVGQVDDILRRALHRPVERDEVAAALGLSVPHLGRLYKAKTGQTVYQRLIHLRLQLAEILLRDSTYSVAQVAAEVGFPSHSHFGKTFRERYGMTPRAWRLQHIDRGPGVAGDQGLDPS